MQRLRNISIIALLLTLPLSSVIRAQGYENDQLLKMIPSKTLFCIRINNLDNTLNQIDQFLAGVSPMPIGTSMLVRAQLMELLGSPQLNGLNTNGSFALFGAISSDQATQNNPMPNVSIGLLVPVTDYKQLIDNNPNCMQPDDKGISRITRNSNPVALIKQVGNYALAGQVNNYDIIVSLAEQMSSSNTESLASIIDSSDAKLAVEEPVWIYGNIQQTSITFGPLLMAGIENIKTIVGTMEQTNTGISTESIQNILNIYISIIETLMKEVKSVSLTINPKAEVLNLTKSITTVPETKMAKMFTSSPSIENNLLSYLDDGAMMNIASNIDTTFWNEGVDMQIKFLSIMSGDNSNSENYQKLKSIAEKAINCVKGPIVYSLSSEADIKPPFKGKYIITINDEKQFDQLVDEASELMKNMGFLDFYKSMGMDVSFTINRDIDTYKGISIDSAKLSMKSTDTETPQAQMITSMYGDGFDYRWAIVNGLFACTIGGDADETIRELIDNIQSDETKQLASETKTALSILPGADKADFFLTVNVLRLFNFVSNMMSSSPVPVPIPSLDTQSKSNIVIAGKTEDGKLIINTALPKAHLQEIMTAILTMQQKLMMQQNSSI